MGFRVACEDVCKVGVRFEAEDEIPRYVVELVAMLLFTVYDFSFRIGDFKSFFMGQERLRTYIPSLTTNKWE
jgi:hypothetical protein